MTKQLLPLTLLIALGLVWGSGYAIARFAVTNGVSPLGYTFWQTLGPAIILSLITYFSGNSLKISWRHLSFYIICGLIGIALPNTNMYYAAAHLPAGLLALLVNTVPLIIYPIALLAKQEKFDPVRLLGLCFAIAGILCLVLPKASFPDVHAVIWVFMALLTPLCFALFAIFINPHRPADSNSLSLAAGMMVVASLFVAPLVLSTHQFYPLHWPLSIPAWIILLEMILSSLGYVLFFWLLKVAGPVYYSLVDGVVAVTGLLWGIVLFNERFNGWHGLAVVLIFSGIAVMTLRQRMNNKKSATRKFNKELPVEFPVRD